MSIEHFAKLQAAHEKHRHECEVRAVMRLKTKKRRLDYLDGVKAERGAESASRLRADVERAWAAR